MMKKKSKVNRTTKRLGGKNGVKQRTKKGDILAAVVRIFKAAPHGYYNCRQICKLTGFDSKEQKIKVFDSLATLVADGVLVEPSPGRFRYYSLGTVAEGFFRRRSNGKNQFVPMDDGEPVSVAERNSKHAMDGDRVKVQIFAHRKGLQMEAEVLEVLETKKSVFVGKLQISRGIAFLTTEDKTLANDIFIPRDMLKGGKNNDKALVRIVEWPDGVKNPLGEVVDILGVAGNNNTEMHAILAEYGLPYQYPAAVEKEAEQLSGIVSNTELAQREDFRQVTTFTIDPYDAKDFDDALSIRQISNGEWEVGVHIADVTHYVKHGSVIDKEAYERATSVYLVDRTVPMLPERLCNGVCSLREGEEKLCFAVVLRMNEDAKVLGTKICRTVIKSRKRFSYEQAQEVIQNKQGELINELLVLDKLAQQLRNKRFLKGAINFDRYEVRFQLDHNGKPVSVYFDESNQAHQLIEEFMLLANKTVAEFIGKKSKKAFVYRIHEPPNHEKMENFSVFVKKMGYKLKTTGTQTEITKSINKLLNNAKGKPEQHIVETLALRSMQKARYSTENLGHYGLAFTYYTHFTSPIRRYPDIMVHRLLTHYLDGGKSVDITTYEEHCKHCSNMEQVAANAERASIKYKQVEFMSDQLGQVFDGVISGVTEWGLYVEINQNKCEGLIPIRNLGDDFYELDEKNYCLIGRRSKHVYRLGDPMKIKVANANLERKQLDFLPA